MPHTMKIFLKLLLERLYSKIDPEVGENQFGFRKKKWYKRGNFLFPNANSKTYPSKQKIIHLFY